MRRDDQGAAVLDLLSAMDPRADAARLAVAGAGRPLPADGAAVVVARPVTRLRIERALRRRGFAVTRRMVVRIRPPSRMLVPLEVGPLGYALRAMTTLPPRVRTPLVALARLPGALRLLGAIAPSAVTVMGRPVSTGAHDPEVPPVLGPDPVILSSEGGTVVARVFAAGGDRPVRFLKTSPDRLPGAALHEAAMAAALSPAARDAGARVPVPVVLPGAPARPMLCQDLIDGEPASRLLARGSMSPEAVLGPVATWIVRWNRVTATPDVADDALITASLRDPVRALGDRLDPGAIRALAALGDRCEGRAVPRVAAHRDLTMANVVIAAGTIGVVDWEKAAERDLPLRDLFYAAVDAVFAAGGHRDRVAAFEEVFAGDGPAARVVAASDAELRGALGIDADIRELCFQACWLQHAADEVRTPGRTDGAFLEICRRASRRVAAHGGTG